MNTLAPSRRLISRATSLVMRSFGGRPMKPSASRTRDSGRIFRNGDCSSWTASACFRVPSKTGSPVVLTKSASTTVSFSVSALARRERKNKPPPIRAAINKAAATAGIVHDFFGTAGTAPIAGVTVPEEVPDEYAAAADPDPDAATGATGFDPESGAAATD